MLCTCTHICLKCRKCHVWTPSPYFLQKHEYVSFSFGLLYLLLRHRSNLCVSPLSNKTFWQVFHKTLEYRTYLEIKLLSWSYMLPIHILRDFVNKNKPLNCSTRKHSSFVSVNNRKKGIHWETTAKIQVVPSN